MCNHRENLSRPSQSCLMLGIRSQLPKNLDETRRFFDKRLHQSYVLPIFPRINWNIVSDQELETPDYFFKFLGIISRYNFCPDRSTSLPKIHLSIEIFWAPDGLPDKNFRVTEVGCNHKKHFCPIFLTLYGMIALVYDLILFITYDFCYVFLP